MMNIETQYAHIRLVLTPQRSALIRDKCQLTTGRGISFDEHAVGNGTLFRPTIVGNKVLRGRCPYIKKIT